MRNNNNNNNNNNNTININNDNNTINDNNNIFDSTTQWYVQNNVSVLENKTHKILKDFEIQTDSLIPVRRPNLVRVNNNKNRKPAK